MFNDLRSVMWTCQWCDCHCSCRNMPVMKLPNYVHSKVGNHRILSAGFTFLPKKLTTFFLVVALKDRLNISPNLTRSTKYVLKIDSCSGWGCTSCPGGCTYTFSLWIRPEKFFFTALGVQVHPLHPLATPMLATQTALLLEGKTPPHCSQDTVTTVHCRPT